MLLPKRAVAELRPFLGSDLKVDGGYGAMGAEGHGELSSFAGSAK